MPDVFAELEWRGFVQQATPELEAHLRAERRSIYCGFDPTAHSLQLGNLMPLMLLKHLQLGGHRPIIVMGGGTGLIGDPSGKRNERPLLSREQIRDHLQRQRDQMAHLLDFDDRHTGALVVNNADWLEKQSLVDFLRGIGKHFSVNVMMQKESVRARLETGISYTEFSYMLLQAYDFLHLFRDKRYHSTVQVGGSDQWGNITAGIDLIRRVEGSEAHGLVSPLLTTSSGAKFGKTEGGAIWLDPAQTSPYQLYQYWINVDDRDVEKYLKLFSLKPRAEIEALIESTRRGPARREAQRTLAAEITERIHGPEAVQAAVSASASAFGEIVDAGDLDSALKAMEQNAPTTEVQIRPATVVDALVAANLAQSKSEARRLIQQGGVYLNTRRVESVEEKVNPEDWVGGSRLLLRRGKKNYALLRAAN
ncbi:MAG TPA: tyrosine--tRNA ligase [Gemmatimonadales bacterium]|nr:tyrosine--tRNA ligase [Gemmatimonadales bacterium]